MGRLFLIALLSLPVTATERVNVTDYPSFDDAAIAAKQLMQSYSSASLYGHVYVPAGAHCLTQSTEPAVWHIAAGAENYCDVNYPNGVDNWSELNGSIIKDSARGRAGTTVYGSTDFSHYVAIRDSVTPGGAAAFSVVGSESGAIAGYVRTGSKTLSSQSTIALQGYAINDNETWKQPAYGGYFEAIGWPNSGVTFGAEFNVTKYGAWSPSQRILPSGIYSDAANISASLWVAGAAGNGPLHGIESVSKTGAAMVIVPGANGTGFDAGIVCTDAALINSTANECFRMGVGQRMIGHSVGFNPKAGWMPYRNPTTGDGEFHITIWPISGPSMVYKFTKDGIVLPSGKVLN